MKSDEKTKIGIIGCGRISGHHCRSIAETNGAELLAVCDLDINKANSYKDEFGIKAYSNYHKMLRDNPSINTVAVITPSGMHFEHVMDVISNYKKNIIVEKPTFMKPSQVSLAYKAAESNGVQIFPVFQNRHNLAVSRVLQALKNDELGKLRTFSVRVRWCREQRYYDLAPWRGTFSMDGGCLTNQGIHHIDLIRYLGGEVERVCSIQKTMGVKVEVEDAVSGIFEFESGAVGALEVTTAARPIDYEASISMVCEKGMAQIGGIAVNELQIFTPNPSECKIYSEDFSGSVYGNGHKIFYDELVATLNSEGKKNQSYDDVFRTISLLNSFYISEESNGWVKVRQSGDSQRLGRPQESIAEIYRSNI
jgi:UDP-N-acetyl-2-amino-2-deoxyglucuronate dehydrogenase